MVHSNYQVSILTKSAGVAAPPQLTAPSTAALCKTKLEKPVATPWGLHDETRLSSPNHSALCIQEPPIYWPRGLTSGTCPLLHKSIKSVEYAPENTLSVTSSFPFPLIQATAPTPRNQMQVSISRTTGVTFSLDLSSLPTSLCSAPGRDFTHKGKKFRQHGRTSTTSGVSAQASDNRWCHSYFSQPLGERASNKLLNSSYERTVWLSGHDI